MKTLIDAINASPMMAYIVATGGGSSFIGQFLTEPGGSQTILKFEVPYAMEATDQFLGKAPDNYVSSECALKFAAKAFIEARKLRPNQAELAGIGLTAALTKGAGERAGRVHKIFAALHKADYTMLYDVELKQGLSRGDEEKLASAIIFQLLSEAAGVPEKLAKLDITKEISGLKLYIQHLLVERKEAGQFAPLYKGEKLVGKNIPNFQLENLVIFPGSFNPPHFGHTQIAKLAHEIAGGAPVWWEVSALNFEKPPLDFITLHNRETMINESGGNPIFTNAPLFRDKLDLFDGMAKNVYFAMGYDTFERIFHESVLKEGVDFITECTLRNIKLIVAGDVQKTIDNIKDNHVKRLLDGIVVKDRRCTEFKANVRASEIRKITKL